MAKAAQTAKQHQALILAPFLDIATEDGSALASFMAHCGIDVATSKAARDQILDHYRLIVRLRHDAKGVFKRRALLQPSQVPHFIQERPGRRLSFWRKRSRERRHELKFRAPGPSISLHHSCQQ